MNDPLIIAGTQIRSRFFLGTGKFSSYPLMRDSIEASGAHVVTVALRRIDPTQEQENILGFIPKGCLVMVNTSGARNAEEAVRIAHLGRAMGCGPWVKIEVIADQRYLLPDNAETIKAARQLASEGFVVMPYMNPDLSDAKRLQDAGVASVMPLGAPIGTNKGVLTRDMIRILVESLNVPVIVDAGIGRPSHAAEAMELGAAAVLSNTAVAVSPDPAATARAFALAVEAGRLAYRAGISPSRDNPEASSPLTGFLH
ncbi:MAG: thiazole synthase [Candidatus Omnitrophota bacterium]